MDIEKKWKEKILEKNRKKIYKKTVKKISLNF